MRPSSILAAFAAGGIALTAAPAWAIPSNFGSPFNPPRGMFVNIGGLQMQSDRTWDVSLGGAYGLTRHIAPSYSLERTNSGSDIVGLGAGTAGEIGGFYARIGLSASDVLESRGGPSYALSVDWGRPLGLGFATYGELGGGLSPESTAGARMSPGLDYDQALELAVNRFVSVDVEYLGGLSPAGRSEDLCADVSAALGRTYLTGTVIVPRAPVPAAPIYLVSTAFQMFP